MSKRVFSQEFRDLIKEVAKDKFPAGFGYIEALEEVVKSACIALAHPEETEHRKPFLEALAKVDFLGDVHE